MGHKPRTSGRGQLGLADDWRSWVVENLLAGVAPEDMVDELVAHGVSRALARREVASVAESPSMPACWSYHVRLRQLELVASLASTHQREAPDPARVARRERIDAEELYERYWAGSQPVVLTELTRGWRARDWTPEALARRFGDVRIEACLGRSTDQHPDMNWQQHRQEMTLAELVARVRAAGVSNDVYLIANNHALEKPELSALVDEIDPDPAIFDLERAGRAVSLWIGPAGTITPLHHDTTNIAFNQIYGRKRVRLIAPWELSVLRGARGFYAAARLDDMELPDGVPVKDVTLEPGETLFIPAGWWHEVESLDVSISFSLMAFRRTNSVDWYRPGHVPYDTPRVTRRQP